MTTVKIHVGLVVYTPFEKDRRQTAELRALTEARLSTFGKQCDVSEATLFAIAQGVDDEAVLELLRQRRELSKHFERVTVIVVRHRDGKRVHPGRGWIYRFLEPAGDWCFVAEDMHALPLSVTAVRDCLAEALAACPEAEVVLGSRGVIAGDDEQQARIERVYPAYRFPVVGRPLLETNEWATYVRRDRLAGFYRPACEFRTLDGAFLAYAGHRVGATNTVRKHFVHQSFGPGRAAWDLLPHGTEESFCFDPPAEPELREWLAGRLESEAEAGFAELEPVERWVVER